MLEPVFNVLVLGAPDFKRLVGKWLVIKRQAGVASFRIIPEAEAEERLKNSGGGIDAVFMQGDSTELMSRLRRLGYNGHLAAFGGDSTAPSQAEIYDVILHNDSDEGIHDGVQLLVKDLGLNETLPARYLREDSSREDTRGVCELVADDPIMFFPAQEEDISGVCEAIPPEVDAALTELIRLPRIRRAANSR